MTKVHGTVSEAEHKPTVADFEDEARRLVQGWLEAVGIGELKTFDFLALVQQVKDALSAAYLKGKRDEYFTIMGNKKGIE